ncbi:hypothetical protein [Solimonas marina]|uniref:hypothetical protein n=1 Tax=Solimonas marina TaxID=2714601 RepID=UPI0019D04BA2|nr:hypothetical protein [Solimonas marina]
MELRKFIAQALCDIAGGVHDAQKTAQGAEIVPTVSSSYKAVETGISELQSVEFEVAVTTTEKTGSEAKLNVVAGLVGGGVQGSSGASSAHVATLRFRIPVRFNRGAAQPGIQPDGPASGGSAG